MANINLNEQDKSTYNDQQYITISYNGKTNDTAGGAEPAQYIKSALVEDNTLILTNKDNSTVEFSPQDSSPWEKGTGLYSVQTKDTGCHAKGECSVAEGEMSFAGVDDTIEDWCEGKGAHAEGGNTTAGGNYSHTEGNSTVTNNPYEHAEGHFNVSNYEEPVYPNAGNTIHSIGVGTNIQNRKNAFEIMQNGDAYLLDVGEYDGTNPNEADTLQNIINNKQDELVSGTNIKTINNQSILGEGNINIQGGGSSVQPDWNQSDSTAADYIKNKPFYENVSEATEIEFGEEEFIVEEETAITLIKQELSEDFVAGDILSIIVNTDSGELVQRTGDIKMFSYDGTNTFAIGNLYLIGIGEDTGEDYLLAFFLDMEGYAFYGQYMQTEVFSGNVNAVTLNHTSIEIQPIDKKFIPELDYVKNSSEITNPTSLVIGKNVYNEMDGITIADEETILYGTSNPDRYHRGIYLVQSAYSGEGPNSGIIDLHDQDNIFIGSPYQETISSSINVTSYDSYEFLNFDQGIIIPNKYAQSFIEFTPYEEGYFQDITNNYWIICDFAVDSAESHGATLNSFIPKNIDEVVKYYGSIDRDGDFHSKWAEINTAIHSEITKYLDETGNTSIPIKITSPLFSVGGQGNTIIGMGAGVSKEYMDCTIIGRNATSIGTEDYGSNIVIGDSATAEGKHSIVIGNNASADNYNITIGENSNSYGNKSVIIGYNLQNTQNDLVNIANAIKVEHASNDVSFPKSRAMIINSSTPGSTKKFKITVDDTGTLSATEV